MKKYLAIAGLIAVTVIWGGGFVASDMPEALTKALEARFLETGSPKNLTLFYAAAQGNRDGSGADHFAHEGMTKRVIGGILMGCALFVGFAFQIVGLQYTTPSKNAFLTALNVVMVPFIAFLILKKKISMKSIAGAVMAIFGVGLLSLEKNLSLGLGDALTLVCAVGFAFQIFFTSEFVKKYRAVVLNFVQMLTAVLLSVVSLFLFGETEFHVTAQGWLSVLYLGVISTALCYLLQTASQRYVDETKAAIILSMESVFGTIFSILILHEQVTLRMICGCVIILAAVIVSNLADAQPELEL